MTGAVAQFPAHGAIDERCHATIAQTTPRHPWFAIAWVMSPGLQAETVLVVQEGLGKVVIFPALHPEQRTVISVGEKPHEIELTPDGRTAFVSNFGLLEANHKAGTPGTTISALDVDRRV